MKRILMTILMVMFMVMVGCDNNGIRITPDDKDNGVGGLGYDCYPNDTCNTGLVCQDGYCQEQDQMVEPDEDQTVEPDEDEIIEPDEDQTVEPDEEYKDPNEWYEDCRIPNKPGYSLNLDLLTCIKGEWVFEMPFNLSYHQYLLPTEQECRNHFYGNQVGGRYRMRVAKIRDFQRMVNADTCPTFHIDSTALNKCVVDSSNLTIDGTCFCYKKLGEDDKEPPMPSLFKDNYRYVGADGRNPDEDFIFMDVKEDYVVNHEHIVNGISLRKSARKSGNFDENITLHPTRFICILEP